MNVRKVMAGSVLGAGLGVAAMLGRGLPRRSASPTTTPTSIRSPSARATSNVRGTNNQGLAVSIFGSASVSAGEDTSGNNLLAVGSTASVTGSAANNTLVSTGGGESRLGGSSHNNLIVNAGGEVTNTGGNAENAVSLSACGTSFSGQAAHVTVSHGVC